MTPSAGTNASCAFTAGADDDIFVSSPSDANWSVDVTHEGFTVHYGSGDFGDCFLEGTLYSGRRMAVCAGRIQPGDAVTASAGYGASVVISNAVSTVDPLYRS